MKQRVRRILRLSIAPLAGLVVLSVTGVFLFSHRLLIVDSGDAKADVLVVLGGAPDRPMRAAELFKAGAAPKILVSGTGDNELNVRLLEKYGVPASAITQETHSVSTKENAQFSVPLLRTIGAKRVVIVTTWYHSRRALACFEHFAPEMTFYSRPSYFGYSRDQWNSQGIGSYIGSEFVKLLGYWVCYGVCPLDL